MLNILNPTNVVLKNPTTNNLKKIIRINIYYYSLHESTSIPRNLPRQRRGKQHEMADIEYLNGTLQNKIEIHYLPFLLSRSKEQTKPKTLQPPS